MASTSFLELTNKLLRMLNEVEIEESQFNDVRGKPAAAKDAIRYAVNDINSQQHHWPFNAAEHTITLTIGQEEYPWPENFKVADWNSFQIQKDDTLNITNSNLRAITKDEWYKYFRDVDYDSETDGRSIPQFVFEAHGRGFGVSPSPDEEYSLKYRYYLFPTELSLSTDTSRIPTEWDHVIVQGGMYYMYMYDDNDERAAVTNKKFLTSLAKMRSILVNNYLYMVDTRVNFGGGWNRSVNYKDSRYA